MARPSPAAVAPRRGASAMLFRTLKSIDHACARAIGPRRVLVEVRTPMNLEVLRPIWEPLARDARIAVTVVAEEKDWVRRSLEAIGVPHRFMDRSEAIWSRFDLAMNADPWNALPLRRCRRRVHFFHGVAGKYDLDDPVTMGKAIDYRIYDRVMFPNADRLARYVGAGVVPHDRAVLAGFPKVDDLVRGRWRAADVRESLGLDPWRETVLYAPTFSPHSSLHLAGERIIEALLESGRNVVVKLHDRSMRPHPKFTAGEDWPARLSKFNGRPRYAFATGGHAGPYLVAADVLITDHSTVGFEFALLDRPILVIDVPELLRYARINREKWDLLRAMAHVVSDVSDLTHALERVLVTERDRYAAVRRATAGAMFAHVGRATDRALEIAYELLELSRPVEAISESEMASGADAHAGG